MLGRKMLHVDVTQHWTAQRRVCWRQLWLSPLQSQVWADLAAEE